MSTVNQVTLFRAGHKTPTNVPRTTDDGDLCISKAFETAEQACCKVRTLDKAVKQAAAAHWKLIAKKTGPKTTERRSSPVSATSHTSIDPDTRRFMVLAIFNRLKIARREATFEMARANKAKLAAFVKPLEALSGTPEAPERSRVEERVAAFFSFRRTTARRYTAREAPLTRV
ncbi:hypothetical protein LTR56_023860 [Elasticomyces elasticus]|nr:hypothetical protein LTR56_023860 [Elasticomyces elasticus]KAK3666858.1 hypothetical protein LTR22_002445 [Elasticomyces elasticus]KAK4907781.1 hypothetical protein LTR49_023245 [Elasticomyces elasticus]KAK5746992.1 hypothetical protein LTS12_022561 [Elasticomyces elasticus]